MTVAGGVRGWYPGRHGSGPCLGLLSLLRFLMIGSLLTTPPHFLTRSFKNDGLKIFCGMPTLPVQLVLLQSHT